MLREVSDLGYNLATSADASSAADRVEVYAELAGRVEDVGVALDLALSPRWGEDDANRVGHF